MLQQARDRRGKLLASCDSWLGENLRIDLESLLNPSPLDTDALSDALWSLLDGTCFSLENRMGGTLKR